MTKKRRDNASLTSDLYLMACIFCAGALSLGVMLTGRQFVLLNTLYLGVTVLLVLCTYFYGLIVGMSLNMLFIFGQVFYMVYRYLNTGSVAFDLVIWLIFPPLLSLTFYAMTRQLQIIQAENLQMQEALVNYGAFDQETELRTTVAFLEDAGVFIETNRRFGIPVSVIAIRIRYYEDMKSMLGPDRMRELIKVASQSIQEATRDNDIVYLINSDLPTWSVLLYTHTDGAQIAVTRIREVFQKKLNASAKLRDVDLSFVIGIKEWNPDELKSANDLMAASIKEIAYDV